MTETGLLMEAATVREWTVRVSGKSHKLYLALGIVSKFDYHRRRDG